MTPNYKQLLIDLITLHEAREEATHEKIRIFLNKDIPKFDNAKQVAYDKHLIAVERFRKHLNTCQSETGMGETPEVKWHKIQTGPTIANQYANHAANLYPDYKVIEGNEHIYILAPIGQPVESELDAFIKGWAKRQEDELS